MTRNESFLLLTVILLAMAISLAYISISSQKPNTKLPAITQVSLPNIDGNISKDNTFTSMYYGFTVEFPVNWTLKFHKYIDAPTYYLKATDNTKNYVFTIWIAKNDVNSMPGPTGYGAGEWINNGYFSLFDQKLDKKALVYQGSKYVINYQTYNERSVIPPSLDTLFLFSIEAQPQSGTLNTPSIPPSAEWEFEQILSTLKIIK